MLPIERAREAVIGGRHRFSQHALAELQADRLHAADAEAAVLTGRIWRTDPEDTPERPGPRYTLVGKATDLVADVAVVFRFEPPEQMIIITCYELKHE